MTPPAEPRFFRLHSGALRAGCVVAIGAAILAALLLSPWCLTSKTDWFMSRDQTISTLRYLAKTMTALRDRGYDLSAVANVDGLLKAALGARLILPGDEVDFAHDAWKTPFVWSVCRASTGDVKVAIISCGKNRLFEHGAGDDIVFELPLTGKGSGSLRYDSEIKANWPPTPVN